MWTLALLLNAPALAAPEMIPAEAMEVVGHEGSDFDLPLRDGGNFKLSDQKGRLVVVSFWASWCGPCRLELPALSAFAAKHPEVRVIAVNVDKERAAADRFLSNLDVKLPIAYDPDAIALGAYAVTSMPTMFIVDRKGQVAWQKVGFGAEKGLSELESTLKGLK